jgi:hypothetical protein
MPNIHELSLNGSSSTSIPCGGLDCTTFWLTMVHFLQLMTFTGAYFSSANLNH